jgi:hypothetical protein
MALFQSSHICIVMWNAGIQNMPLEKKEATKNNPSIENWNSNRAYLPTRENLADKARKRSQRRKIHAMP